MWPDQLSVRRGGLKGGGIDDGSRLYRGGRMRTAATVGSVGSWVGRFIIIVSSCLVSSLPRSRSLDSLPSSQVRQSPSSSSAFGSRPVRRNWPWMGCSSCGMPAFAAPVRRLCRTSTPRVYSSSSSPAPASSSSSSLSSSSSSCVSQRHANVAPTTSTWTPAASSATAHAITSRNTWSSAAHHGAVSDATKPARTTVSARHATYPAAVYARASTVTPSCGLRYEPWRSDAGSLESSDADDGRSVSEDADGSGATGFIFGLVAGCCSSACRRSEGPVMSSTYIASS
mmetsp:Transcript_16657/g.51689  ORF Transcript_16657/g.51689 Transcript_16657/m.51689 type:complete len:285 (+) Transcript_16657:56-910(+)